MGEEGRDRSSPFPHEGSPSALGPSEPSPSSSESSPSLSKSSTVSEDMSKLAISIQKQDAKADTLKKLGEKKSSGLVPPRRKSEGKTGLCQYTVETNHLPLKILVKEIIHYDVDIQPDKPKKFMWPVMREVQRICYPSQFPAFDGRKNLYAAGFMNFGAEMSTAVTIRDEERNQDIEFKVGIKFAARIDMSLLQNYMQGGRSVDMPQRQIQAIDVVLRCAPSLRFVPVGRSYFTPPSGIGFDLTGGMELWYGFYQSAILGWKPYVNVDVAHKGFPKAQPCIELVRELLPELAFNAIITGRDIDTLSKYLKGLKVNYEIPRVPNSRRTYKVNALVEPANQSRFEHDGKTMTVEEYYRNQKGYALRCPNFPLLHLGSLQKKMYMPLELCAVAPAQAIMRKLNEMQTTKMIRQAATPAYVRKEKIGNALRQVGYQNDRTLNEFGISVGNQFEKVGARILAPPDIEYSNKDAVTPRQGVWMAKPFHQVADMTNWAILNLDSYVREADIEEFVKQMSSATKRAGMRFSPPVRRSVDTRRDRRADSWLDFAKNQNFQIIVVIVSQVPGQYAKIKQMAELQLGLLTQCVKGNTIKRLKPATTSNILLKINSKLNGINHRLLQRPRCFSKPIMIVGADVTHPSPEATGIPSAAAVAASFDANAFRYAIKYRLQPPRMEVIEDLENIMRELLLVFHEKTKFKPEKIIIFRDGVSDGQFSVVLNTELMAIRRACSGIERDYKPSITFLVVQKRHHTRFFPTNDLPKNFVDQKNGNVPAGTIVDTQITHPTELDFYLVSHASLQGTSRPTKYHLLWDDSDFSTDELEALTYHLCHMFSRCTRSVSYPAPTYYAHLAAFRARVYLDDGRPLNMNDLGKEQKLRTLKQNFANNWPMFFV